MKNMPTLFVAIIFAVASCNGGSAANGVSRQLAFETLQKASGCNGDVRIQGAGNKVLTDKMSFEDELAGSFQTPLAGVYDIDFSKSVVVVAHAGVRSSCAASIAVSDVRETERDIQVEITISSGKNCAADGAISYPVVFSEIPKSTKPYSFIERMNDTCSPLPN